MLPEVFTTQVKSSKASCAHISKLDEESIWLALVGHDASNLIPKVLVQEARQLLLQVFDLYKIRSLIWSGLTTTQVEARTLCSTESYAQPLQVVKILQIDSKIICKL